MISVSGKGSGRVSVAGLACLKDDAPGRLSYRMRIHRGRKGERRSMSEADYADLIAAAHRTLAAPVILIWDNLNTHRSAVVRRCTGVRCRCLMRARRGGAVRGCRSCPPPGAGSARPSSALHSLAPDPG